MSFAPPAAGIELYPCHLKISSLCIEPKNSYTEPYKSFKNTSHPAAGSQSISVAGLYVCAHQVSCSSSWTFPLSCAGFSIDCLTNDVTVPLTQGRHYPTEAQSHQPDNYWGFFGHCNSIRGVVCIYLTFYCVLYSYTLQILG